MEFVLVAFVVPLVCLLIGAWCGDANGYDRAKAEMKEADGNLQPSRPNT